MSHAPFALIIDDDPKLAQLLAEHLRTRLYETRMLRDGLRVVEAIRERRPDVVLLDLMLPGRGELEVFADVRKVADIPIIMVSERGEEVDRLIGLELGADDYICKPCSPREVVARVKAVLRRTRRAAPASLGLTMDEERYEAMLDGITLPLTPVEFRLLKTLASRPGRIFPRAQLLDAIYTDNRVVEDRVIDCHVKNLRRKLDGAHRGIDLLRSVYGVGYKFEL